MDPTLDNSEHGRSHRFGRVRRAGCAVGLVLVVAAFAGCGTRVIERERPIAFGDAGQGWQLVMPSGFAVADADAPELGRRDASLGRSPASGVAALLYPGEPRPSLLHSHRIYLNRSPSHPVFFFPPTRQHHHHRGYYRGRWR